MDHAELVAQFCGITGAAAAVAEQYLEAMSGDLAKAIDFFMDHPPNDMPEEPAGRTAGGAHACARADVKRVRAAAAAVAPSVLTMPATPPCADVQHQQRNQMPSRCACRCRQQQPQPHALALQQRRPLGLCVPALAAC